MLLRRKQSCPVNAKIWHTFYRRDFLAFVAERIDGRALALFSDCIDRIVSSLLRVNDVPLPEDIEIFVGISENMVPGRYRVNDKSDDDEPTDLRTFVNDINNPEVSASRFSERQSVMNEKASA